MAVLASSLFVPLAFAAKPELEELDGLDQFRRLFNAARGTPRIVLLLSPT
jgi:hypothetical protein